jgi:hypothetical protein
VTVSSDVGSKKSPAAVSEFIKDARPTALSRRYKSLKKEALVKLMSEMQKETETVAPPRLSPQRAIHRVVVVGFVAVACLGIAFAIRKLARPSNDYHAVPSDFQI